MGCTSFSDPSSTRTLWCPALRPDADAGKLHARVQRPHVQISLYVDRAAVTGRCDNDICGGTTEPSTPVQWRWPHDALRRRGPENHDSRGFRSKPDPVTRRPVSVKRSRSAGWRNFPFCTCAVEKDTSDLCKQAFSDESVEPISGYRYLGLRGRWGAERGGENDPRNFGSEVDGWSRLTEVVVQNE